MGTQKLDKALGTHINIDSTNIPDDIILESDISPGAITNTEMADDSIDSDQYVDGSIDNAHLADAAVDTEEIANQAIEGGKVDFFQSAAIDGTGSEVDTAHGLGRTPTIVIVYLVQKDTGATVEIIEGTHDGTNIKVNAPAEVKYKIVAF